MKKISDKQLKKWGKAYQKGRPMPLRAELESFEYILDNLDKFLSEYIRVFKREMSFKNFIGLQIGLWQVKYGFHRKWSE